MIVPQPIQELIDSSGNSFHAKVARWLTDNGWALQVSPYYLDPVQQKAREVDLIAEKAWPLNTMFGTPVGHVLVRLYIECKFVPGHAVFWFSEKSTAEAKTLVTSTGVFRADNSYTNKHHYLSLSQRVAKLFTSSQTKGQEADLFYKALNQILSAFVAFRSRAPSPQSLQGQLRGRIVLIEFPVIVCSSFQNIYSADFLGQGPTEAVQTPFQLEVRYAHDGATGSHKNEYFLIDIASYDTLPVLMSAIAQDVDAAIVLKASN